MAYVRETAAPSVEPVLSADLLTFMSLPTSVGDQTVLLKAARQSGETLTGRSLAVRPFLQVMDSFPCGSIRLFYPPLVSVTAIKYLDLNGAEQTFSSENYIVDKVSQPGRIALKPGKSWPSIMSGPAPVRIEFTAGYLPAADVEIPGALIIPEVLKLGILNLAAFWFQNKGAIHASAAIGKGFDVPPYIEKIFTTQAISDLLPIEF